MDIRLNKEGEVPLYRQLADGIVALVQTGELPINTILPSERSFMESYDISRSTVRQAFDRLAKLGYLRREHGRGTFVELPGSSHQLGSFLDFKEEMNAAGREAETRIRFFRIIRCYPQLAPVLGLTEKDYAYKFIRLHLADGVPLLLETTYLPYSRFEGFVRQDLEKASLHEIISRWYRTPVTHTLESFEICRLTREEAEELCCEEGTPGLRKKRTSYFGNEAVEYTISITPEKGLVFKAVTRN